PWLVILHDQLALAHNQIRGIALAVGNKHTQELTKEQIASFVALAGVVLIARPVSFFASPTSPALESAASLASASSNFTSMPQNFTSDLDLPLDPATDGIPDVSPTERLIGILMALLSVLGASAAYTTIRALGTWSNQTADQMTTVRPGSIAAYFGADLLSRAGRRRQVEWFEVVL
ncbi:hypothetical protein QBC45DRAFT_409494, partial [Copromyces sp. CBS 386.78]